MEDLLVSGGRAVMMMYDSVLRIMGGLCVGFLMKLVGVGGASRVFATIRSEDFVVARCGLNRTEAATRSDASPRASSETARVADCCPRSCTLPLSSESRAAILRVEDLLVVSGADSVLRIMGGLGAGFLMKLIGVGGASRVFATIRSEDFFVARCGLNRTGAATRSDASPRASCPRSCTLPLPSNSRAAKPMHSPL